ncbi:hypothetical protein [Kordiimonas sp.]|uniref:hypothetical protein n=1 Tax=Kordiimonas sp. TaxID=1970157 RepID=UPI003A900625
MNHKVYMWGHVANPLREALQAITGEIPPVELCPDGAYSCKDLTGQQIMDLQDWCSSKANPPWATGLWVLEAAERCVSGAVESVNIPGKDKHDRA